MHDPTDLLTPAPADLDPALKGRVLEATLGELRRQRRKRRQRRVAALGALAAGLLLFAMIPPAPQIEWPKQPAHEPPPPASAVALEWEALDRPEEAKRLYRQAGERYLEEDDPAGAVRCYGGALDAGTPDDLEIAPEDDYLLMAIKLARKKESEE